MAAAQTQPGVDPTITTTETIEALDRTALLIQRDFYPQLNKTEIVNGLTSMRVKIIADGHNLARVSAQTFVITTAIALTQTGARVMLDLPDVRMRTQQVPLGPTGLRTALAAHLEHLPAYDPEPTAAPDVTIVVGDTPLDTNVAPPTVLRVQGGDWDAEISSDSRPSAPWTGDYPFGAGLAAVAVAADVFRLTVAKLGVSHGVEPPPSFSWTVAPVTHMALGPIALRGRQLITTDIISAGAITNAALMTLARVPGLVLRGRLFDDDPVAVSNLNRYPMLSLKHIGMVKPAAVVELLPGQLGPRGGGSAIHTRDRHAARTVGEIGPDRGG